MAKTNSKTRANTSPPETESDGPVREMRLDQAHQLGSAKSNTAVPSPHIETSASEHAPGGPHATWEEESLSKAETALVAAWDELHGPAYEKESPSLDPLAAAVDPNQMPGATSLEMLRVARTQLQQLATLLNERQAELDRRATNLDARGSELEADQRAFQLVLREYHESETERQEKLAEQEQTLAAREQALAALELSQQERYEERAEEVRQRAAQLELREVRLREWEITLSQRTGQLELHEHETENAEAALSERTQGLVVEAELLARRADSLRQLLREYLAGETPTAVTIERSRAAAQDAQDGFPESEGEWPAFVAAICELAERRTRLERGEASLAKSEAEMLKQREHLAHEQARWERRKQAEQRDVEEERRLARGEADAIREQRLGSERELETRRAAIEELHGGLILAQQELLQERLALEELVAEFGGRINSTRFTEAQLRGRQKLAELYRHQTEQLLAERLKLEELAERLPIEQRRLQAQRVELEQWMADRQDDLGGLTARLSAREQELEQIAAQLEDESRRWSRERLDYERDLRCLLTELGR